MVEVINIGNQKTVLPDPLLRCRDLAALVVMVMAAVSFRGTPANAQQPASVVSGAPAEGVVVAFVAEVPWPADAGMANPLELWARKLSAAWSPPPGESNARVRNLKPELSWKRLAQTARNKTADLFPVHGYEYLEQGTEADMEALLTPSREGKAAKTEFIIIGRQGERTEGQQFSITELSGKQILVDRGGCGDLVYRWLEVEIVPATGKARAENYAQTFADFRTATSATEAVLAVYFSEAEACIVSREAFARVQRTNPSGLTSKLEELAHSPKLLQHIIACRRSLPAELRGSILQSASTVNLEFGCQHGLMPVEPEDIAPLVTLTNQWRRYFDGPAAAKPDSRFTPAAATTPARATDGRRLP